MSQEALRAWLRLLSASVAIRKAVDARLRARFGVSLSRFDVMAALERVGENGLRAGTLSERLMVTEGNTTQVTAPLIRDGLVRKRSDEGDGRAVIFSLTAKGEKLFARMAEQNRAWIAEAFADFSPGDFEALRGLLARIRTPSDDRDETDRNAA